MDEIREQAMRVAFEEVFRLYQAMTNLTATSTSTDARASAEIERLGAGADALSRLWETGPDAVEWHWLNSAEVDWRMAPEAMRRRMDALHHDARTGDTPYSPLQIRSLHQAGLLVDPIYSQQLQWRTEHLADAAELGRINARLESPGLTDQQWESLNSIRDQLHAAREAASLRWSVERRAWEQRYNDEPANNAERRDAYATAYAAERDAYATARPSATPTDIVAAQRDGTRIGQLLDAATPRHQQPTATPPPGTGTSPGEAATALDATDPYPGAGHELG